MVQVSAFDPRHRLAFSSSNGMPEFLLKTVRTYSIAPRPEGRTELSQVLEVTGMLHPIFLLAAPDPEPVLREVGEALKRRAETA